MKILLFAAGHTIEVTDNDALKLKQQLGSGLSEGAFTLESGGVIFKSNVAALLDKADLIGVDDAPSDKEAPKPRAKK